MPKSLSPRHPLAMAALLLTTASAGAAEYSIEPIVSPDGGYVVPTSIASNDMVVGQVWYGPNFCFKYLNGVFTKLPMPSGYRSCEMAVTNLQGDITMTMVPSYNPNTTRVVVLTTKGQFLDLSGLTDEGNTVYASKGGTMVGTSKSADGKNQAYIFKRKGAGINVGALTGMASSWLLGLNNKGWAVGHAIAEGSNQLRAFRYKDGKITWLAGLAEGGTSMAVDINSGGTTVGTSESTAGDLKSDRAVTWQGKSNPTNLGSFAGLYTRAAAINSAGVVVGRYGDSAHGLRVRDGVMSRLADLIDRQQMSQWLIIGYATAINDKGMILGGDSVYNGRYGTGYLLRPLP